MRTVLASIIVSGVLIAGCVADNAEPEADNRGAAVATVGGRVISAPMLAIYSRTRAQKAAEDLSPDERDDLMAELTQLALLANAADADGLLNDQTVAAELELQRLQLIARRQIAAYLDANPATEAELQQAYSDNLEQLAGVQYKARHILVDEESEAREIITALQQGADFQELARTRSKDSSGGDLGWFSADRMVPPFAAAVRTMEVGTFSSTPVQTRFGWHVILLEDKSDSQAPALDAVRNDVRNMVEQRKIQGYLEDLSTFSSAQ